MENPLSDTKGTIGIIGYPARHSLSPIFQQAAFNDKKLNLQYEIWEPPPSDLESVVAMMRGSRIHGANVTMPFKETIMDLLDSIHPSAQLIGAVNTIVKSNGKLVGYNTDGIGFVEALSDIGFVAEGKRIMVIGAGGAARSIAFALTQENPSQIVIANRNKDRAANLCTSLGSVTKDIAIPIEFTEVTMREWIPKCTLVVNATSIGMHPHADISPIPDMLIHPDIFVYDLVYNPIETVLVQSARTRGAVAAGGLSMLVYQGAHAFTLWTGLSATRDLMMQAAKGYIAQSSTN